jgi:photosystem II stability/assembly factor-like uncharacterized protein
MFGVRRLSGVAAIVVLLAVTILLVAAAIIRHHKHVPASVTNVPVINQTPLVVPFQPAAGVRAATKQPAPLLTASNADAAFFAHGGCGQQPKLAGSLDGGQTWLALTPPAPHLLQVLLIGKRSGFVIGADSNCVPSKYTPNGPNAWSPAAPVTGTWFATSNGIHTPGGAIVSPCGTTHPQPISLAASGRQDAIVICRVGIYLTTSGGGQWSVAGELPKGHPVSVSLTTKGRGILLLAHGSACRGLRVADTSDSGLTWRQDACLGDLTSSAAVAVAPNGFGIATDGAKTSYTTADAGVTWH